MTKFHTLLSYTRAVYDIASSILSDLGLSSMVFLLKSSGLCLNIGVCRKGNLTTTESGARRRCSYTGTAQHLLRSPQGEKDFARPVGSDCFAATSGDRNISLLAQQQLNDERLSEFSQWKEILHILSSSKGPLVSKSPSQLPQGLGKRIFSALFYIICMWFTISTVLCWSQINPFCWVK